MSSPATSDAAAPTWRHSLTLRLLVAVIALLGLVVLTMVISIVTAFRVPGLFPQESSLRVVRFVAGELGQAGDERAAGALVSRLGAESELDLSLFRLDGTRVATAGQALGLPDEATRQRLAAGPGFVSGLVLSAGAPVSGPGGPWGVVLVRFHNRAVERMPLRTLVVISVTLSVAVLLVLPLARSLRVRLLRLVRAAEALGSGRLDVRAGPMGDDEIGWLARSFDAMAERIASVRRMERQLLAGVSHELRTPLSRMRVTLSLLDCDEPAQRQRVRDLEEEIDELHHLVQDVLLDSQIEHGALPLQRRWIQARELSLRARRRAAVDRDVQVTVSETLFIEVDEALFSRVLDNLVDNACKYDPTGAPVRIEGWEEGEAAVLIVADAGPGVDPSEADALFLPFVRGRRALSGGIGLGLSLCRRIVEAHGGTLRFVPSARGARVELRLPSAASSVSQGG